MCIQRFNALAARSVTGCRGGVTSVRRSVRAAATRGAWTRSRGVLQHADPDLDLLREAGAARAAASASGEPAEAQKGKRRGTTEIVSRKITACSNAPTRKKSLNR
jgi:hypothetical protein